MCMYLCVYTSNFQALVPKGYGYLHGSGAEVEGAYIWPIGGPVHGVFCYIGTDRFTRMVTCTLSYDNFLK